MKNLITLIQERKESLPKRQRALCNYILDNPLEAGMLTITELASRAHIGSATVVRTIQSLGYDSVNQFKADLRSSTFLRASTSYDAYLDMNRRMTPGKEKLYASISTYSEYIKGLNNPRFIAQIESGAEQILAARRVFILGLRSSSAIALMLEFSLRDAGINVVQMSIQSDYMYDRISEMTPADLLLCIAALPVTKRTLEAIQVCSKRSVPIVAITTSHESPAARYADVTVCTESFGLTFPTAPTIFAAELLCVCVGQRSEEAGRHMQRMEALLEENGIAIWDSGAP